VEELAAGAGLQLRGPHGVADLEAVQRFLGPQYQISVYQGQNPAVACYGANDAARHINVLVRTDLAEEVGVHGPQPDDPTGHAIVICSMAAMMGVRKWCEACKGSAGQGRHKCRASSCRLCYALDCHNRNVVRHFYASCEECGENFATRQCMDSHVESRCNKTRRCRLCWELCTKSAFSKHHKHCGTPFCVSCRRRHSPTDFCYVTGERGKVGADEDTIWAASDEEGEVVGAVGEQVGEVAETQSSVDAEEAGEAEEERVSPRPRNRVYCDAETVECPETGDHKANLVVAQKVVDGVDGHTTYIYSGDEAMKEFAQACLDMNGPFYNSYLVWHNMASFDGHLLYKELLDLETAPTLILRGQKILTLRLHKQKIALRDSLLFLTGVPLAKFAQIFNLQDGDKSDFPHKLNGPRWVNFDTAPDYEEDGERFPAFHYFGTENARPGPLERLKKWHAERVAEFQANPLLRYNPTRELLR
jgi:hypothetical protein